MKQLYIDNPSEHKFLVKAANSPSTFSNMIGSVLSLLPGLHRRKTKLTTLKMLKTRSKLHKLHPKLQLLKPSTPYRVVKV